MEERYYAVVRSGQNDDLTHWKYIRREKGEDGKYRYYYPGDYAITGYGYKRDADILDEKGRKIVKNAYSTLGKPNFSPREFSKKTAKADEIFNEAKEYRFKKYRSKSLFGKIERMSLNTPTFYQMKEGGKKKVSELLNKSGRNLIKLSEDIVK